MHTVLTGENCLSRFLERSPLSMLHLSVLPEKTLAGSRQASDSRLTFSAFEERWISSLLLGRHSSSYGNLLIQSLCTY